MECGLCVLKFFFCFLQRKSMCFFLEAGKYCKQLKSKVKKSRSELFGLSSPDLRSGFSRGCYSMSILAHRESSVDITESVVGRETQKVCLLDFWGVKQASSASSFISSSGIAARFPFSFGKSDLCLRSHSRCSDL